MARRIVVTGATGFIGRHLIPELKAKAYDVVVPPRRELAPDAHWEDVLAGAHAVVHLAALAHERAVACERARDYETLRRVNVLGTERLAREAARVGVHRFVFLSSIGACGDETHGVPFTEECHPEPRSLYGRSKLEAEERLVALSQGTELQVTTLRPTLVYGPENGGNFLRLLKAVERGWPLPFGRVRNRRNLAYVGNVVSAIATFLDHEGASGAWVICDADALSTPELVRRLAEGMGRPARLLPIPPAMLLAGGRLLGRKELVRRLVGSLEADCGKARRVLGWAPPISVNEGLARTASWYRGRRQAYSA